ncbi:glycosyltransferase [Chitinimonas arctica]|uniref:Glycosyltransferase n=1 Tax=Chitinimonas arctica TaxID=2594795 RepID=A0A516SGN1_9NEIS|nr:glycosyltransferase [Chitinimonas arctica]QDQ27260.1 glycosyltransferase [Chitinimonas arctica]
MPTLHLIATRSSEELAVVTLQDLWTNSRASLAVTVHARPETCARLRVRWPENDRLSYQAWDAALPLAALLAGEGGQLWLAAGVRLPLAWDARLLAMAAATPGYGAVSVLCPAFTEHYPAKLTSEDMDDWQGLDRRVLDGGMGHVLATLHVSPVCALLQTAVPAGVQSDDLDFGDPAQRSVFGVRLLDAGVALGVADSVLVHWSGPALPLPALPERLKGLGAAHAHANPLSWRQFRAEPFPGYLLDGRPVQLHIMHSWGGGLERWVKDYCEADSGRINLVLKSVGNIGLYGQRLALYLDIDDAQPVRVWDFAVAIRGTAVSHPDYRRALREIVEVFMVDAVLVSSLIGHSLDVFDTGLPTTHIWHEYYPFCPALYIYFDGICRSCDSSRLRACAATNPASRLFANVSDSELLNVRSAYVQTVRRQGTCLVAPSASVIRHFGELAPALLQGDPVVIAHGTDWPEAARVPAPLASARPRVVVLGVLIGHKGADLFDALLPKLLKVADVVLLGCGESGERYMRVAGVRVISRYERHALPDLLVELAPSAGLLLSVWPETFSYTLSELLCAGIPPIAPAHGSFLDRIKDGENGFLCEPSVAAFEQRLAELLTERTALERVRVNLQTFRHRSRAEMVADYHALLPVQAMGSGFSPRPRGGEPEVVARRYFPGGAPLPLREALEIAHGYLRSKIAHSARLRLWQRRLVNGGLEIVMRVLYRIWRLAAHRR